MNPTQSAIVLFDNYVDGEADMDASDGRLDQIRDYRKLALLKWNIANKDYKAVQSTLPVPRSTDRNATQVLFSLCSAADVQVLHIAVLLHYGADFNAKEEQNRTPLHCLSQSLSGSACKYLIQCGATCDVVEDTHQRTPLIIACMPRIEKNVLCDQLETVETLLAMNPATLDHADCDGNTALDYALLSRNVYLTRRLLAAGCSVMKSNFHKSKNENEPNTLATKCINYRVSDRWLYWQRLFASKELLCERLANFRLREEVAAYKRTQLSTLYNNHEIGTLAVHNFPERTNASEKAGIIDATALEARKANRRKHRENKNQLRAAKEQHAAEIKREQKREQYMKRVEKEFHVSFKGLFT